MMCPRCHAENREGLRFCEDCTPVHHGVEVRPYRK